MKLSDLHKYNPITIQCHDNPDADALASGYGLYCYFSELGKTVRLIYSGKNRIQKSNLKLMVEELKLPVEYVPVGFGETVRLDGLLITVDCQYGSGNVTRFEADEIAVIDHHQKEQEPGPLSVINSRLGSCATLVWKMMQSEGFDVNARENLGTALYYGLYTDTSQFAELYNPLDMDMREALVFDKGLINLFRNSNLSLQELEIAGIAMIRHTYNDDYQFAVIKAKPCDPNILGLISDFLLQVDAIKTCAVFNETGDGYKFSVRSCTKEVNAGDLAAFLAQDMGSGGGHFEKAGGYISLRRYEDKYPTLHSEGYFNNRMTEYFDSFELIYAKEYELEADKMERYKKNKVPVAYIKSDEIFPVGTPITVRTLKGDVNIEVSKNLFIMFDVKGEVRPEKRENFMEDYEILETEELLHQAITTSEYVPVIKNRATGKDVSVADYMGFCVPVGEKYVYAKQLEKGVKVFTLQDKDGYMTGAPGDYLAAYCDNPEDIFVVEKARFEKRYTAVISAC